MFSRRTIMLRKTLFLAVAALLTTLAFAADAKAWFAYHYGGYRGGYGGYRGGVYGGYRGGVYGGYRGYGYHYGGYGGYRYGYYRRW
jgi:hypothetical protein